MYRKCLVSIGVIVLFTGMLHAVPNLGATTGVAFEWAKKNSSIVGVCLMVPPAVEVSTPGPLTLKPFEGINDYRGCLDLTLYNNFTNLHMHAVVTPLTPNGNWSVRLRDLDDSGQISSPGLQTELVVPNHHLRNNPGKVRLCVRARNVDSPYGPGVTVATVAITMSMANGTQVGGARVPVAYE